MNDCWEPVNGDRVPERVCRFLVNQVWVSEKADPFSYLGLRHNFRHGLKWTFYVSLVFISYFIILNFTILHNNLDFRIGFNELLFTSMLNIALVAFFPH